MSEQFLKLVNQAGFFGESFYPIFGTSQEAALQNLIELVVQECAQFCEDKNSKLLGTMMKEHFGIEK